MCTVSIVLVVTFLSYFGETSADTVIESAEEAQHFSLNITQICGNWTIDLNDYLTSTPSAQTQVLCSDLKATGRKCKDHLILNMPSLCKRLTSPLEVNDGELFEKLGLSKEWACEPFQEKLMPSIEDTAALFVDGAFYKTVPDKQLSKIRRIRQTTNNSAPFEVTKSEEDGSLSLTVFGNTHEKLAVLPNWIFEYFGGVKFSLSHICSGAIPLDLIESDENPQVLDEGESSKHLPIGIDLSIVKNLDMKELAAKLKNDTELDDIFQRFLRMKIVGEKPFPSSFVLPILKRSNYDPRYPPTLFAGQTVDVRVGIHVQSMSNFELPTMDYDMDLWLRMTWRDPRLAHGFPRPILINEQTFLKKLWRPDPFFANAKDSLFHKVTFLNFYMLIFPNGEMFFESRIYLKPSCQLVLCRYPHDNQACSLISVGFTNDVVQFYWFSRKEDAIFMNRNVQFPDLYVFNHEKTTCNGMRKSGNFSCLEAKFYLKRNLGSHLAQTYIPTATCVLFSWISVWLPEEFVEGRVFVSLTVFLTLSAENNAAKEVLPKVSYIKAIDMWFGFTTIFVFSTMLQAIIVISFEHNSRMIQKKAQNSKTRLSAHDYNKLVMQSKMYHRWGRGLDTFCKVMYPVIFLIFLFIYFFIIIQGDDKKCLRESGQHTEL
ncbi:hypothetical protein QR680_001606 [Steinernema hermaphroditum]|uniref:Neurotransmitter-gated ion-channel ligand-binding domain-containing protein n=1 Tax=Steinernema hermaphroditum TaxID=289476 RepID=A0AA39GZ15_9BILA|nr:hypothetical protein QR680_001606 [Steinernema hermaphroditum]